MKENINTNELYPKPWNGKAIILVDLDAFFASVEQLDHPDWRGLPVIVGGDPDKHGVVSTCSYEARKYGVRSAMPASNAKRLCPDAIWTHGNFARYRELSRAVMQIIENETPYVQQVSIDEAFADISPTRMNKEHPISIANRIRSKVSQLGITCSIGLGTSKSVAKIASDVDKPNGLTVVYPGTERRFLKDMPISVVSGIGPSSQERLREKGIYTLNDLSGASDTLLKSIFGKNAQEMRARAQGSDSPVINSEDSVKSISHETTFATDLENRDEIEAAISTLLAKVGRRLRKKHLKGNVLTLKVRFDNRVTQNSQTHIDKALDDEIALYPLFLELLSRIWHEGQKIRLIGVAVSGFGSNENRQEALFDIKELENNTGIDKAAKPLIEDEELRHNLLDATDTLKNKFGEDAIVFGAKFKTSENNTGSSSKNPSDYK